MAADNSIGVHALVAIIDENCTPDHILGYSVKLPLHYLKEAWFTV
jgi:hypothetical protein